MSSLIVPSPVWYLKHKVLTSIPRLLYKPQLWIISKICWMLTLARHYTNNYFMDITWFISQNNLGNMMFSLFRVTKVTSERAHRWHNYGIPGFQSKGNGDKHVHNHGVASPFLMTQHLPKAFMTSGFGDSQDDVSSTPGLSHIIWIKLYRTYDLRPLAETSFLWFSPCCALWFVWWAKAKSLPFKCICVYVYVFFFLIKP